MWSMKRFFGRPTERCPSVSSLQSNRRGSRLSGILITSQLFLEEQVFSYSSSTAQTNNRHGASDIAQSRYCT